jgi:hypothetical protein
MVLSILVCVFVGSLLVALILAVCIECRRETKRLQTRMVAFSKTNVLVRKNGVFVYADGTSRGK